MASTLVNSRSTNEAHGRGLTKPETPKHYRDLQTAVALTKTDYFYISSSGSHVHSNDSHLLYTYMLTPIISFLSLYTYTLTTIISQTAVTLTKTDYFYMSSSVSLSVCVYNFSVYVYALSAYEYASLSVYECVHSMLFLYTSACMPCSLRIRVPLSVFECLSLYMSAADRDLRFVYLPLHQREKRTFSSEQKGNTLQGPRTVT